MMSTTNVNKTEPGASNQKQMNAIIYIRMSTHYQVQTDSNSAEMQRDVCLKMCESKNLHVKKIIEQVKSGRKYRKDLFDVIEKEMRAKDCIVVYSITRFARRQTHAHALAEKLEKKKCRLICCNENIDTADNSQIMGLFAWLAEFESFQTGQRVKLSMKAKKERMEHIGALPYGYRYSDGPGSPLEINPEESVILNTIRKMYNEDNASYNSIARYLNVQRIPMAKKKDQIGGWTPLTVKKLITRDDSKLLLKGKRSWYKDKDEEELNNKTKHETKIEVFEDPETQEDSPEVSEPAPPVHEHLDPSSNRAQLYTKPIKLLRFMVGKNNKLGFSEEEINSMTMDDLVELLDS